MTAKVRREERTEETAVEQPKRQVVRKNTGLTMQRYFTQAERRSVRCRRMGEAECRDLRRKRRGGFLNNTR